MHELNISQILSWVDRWNWWRLILNRSKAMLKTNIRRHNKITQACSFRYMYWVHAKFAYWWGLILRRSHIKRWQKNQTCICAIINKILQCLRYWASLTSTLWLLWQPGSDTIPLKIEFVGLIRQLPTVDLNYIGLYSICITQSSFYF